MEAADSSKTLVFAVKTAGYHKPEDHNLRNIPLKWLVMDVIC